MSVTEEKLPDQVAEMTVTPRRALRRAFRAEVVLAAALCAYAALAVLAHQYAYFAWDLRLARAIQSVALPGFAALMAGVSALGNGWLPFALVGAAGMGLLLARCRPEGVVCLAGVALGSLVERLLKYLSGRPRPDGSLVQILAEVRHESFPSGHVVFFVEFFGFLLFLSYVLLRRGLLRNVALTVTGALVALVGVSRVYMGAHWPSDVAGAYLAGGIWLALMIEVYRRWKARRTGVAG